MSSVDPWRPASRTTAVAAPSRALPQSAIDHWPAQWVAPTPPLPAPIAIHVAPPPTLVISGGDGSGLFIRLLWMACIGWWLGPIVACVGWLLLLLPPAGIAVLGAVPKATSLRPAPLRITSLAAGQAYQPGRVPQVRWWLRLLYIYPCGWLLGGLWIGLGCLFFLPFINWFCWPLGVAILDRAPAVATLQRR